MQICSTLGFKPLNNALKTNIGGCIKHIKDNNANVFLKKRSLVRSLVELNMLIFKAMNPE